MPVVLDAVPFDMPLPAEDAGVGELGDGALEGGVAVDASDDPGVDEVPDGGVVDCASVVGGGVDAVGAVMSDVVAQAAPATAMIEAAARVANFRCTDFIGDPFT